MKSKEANFGVIFRHWIKAYPQMSGTFELKDAGESLSIPFDCVKEEQINFALAVHSDKGVLIRNQGGSGEPDYDYYRNAPARIVIRFQEIFCVIDIDSFLLEKERSTRKSLTKQRAKDIAVQVVNIVSPVRVIHS